MEREGKMFKRLTHHIPGLRYIYWHPLQNNIEFWYRDSRPEAFTEAIEAMDERMMFAILRPGYTVVPTPPGVPHPSLVQAEAEEATTPETNTNEDENKDGDEEMEQAAGEAAGEDVEQAVGQEVEAVVEEEVVEEEMNGANTCPDTTTPPITAELAWAHQHLTHFKNTANIKCIYDIPDLTCYGQPWMLTPALADALDIQLHSQRLPKGETLVYDRRECGVIWMRRDGSSYEIRANQVESVVFASRLVLRCCTKHCCNTGCRTMMPPNAVLWADAYHCMQNMIGYSGGGWGKRHGRGCDRVTGGDTATGRGGVGGGVDGEDGVDEGMGGAMGEATDGVEGVGIRAEEQEEAAGGRGES